LGHHSVFILLLGFSAFPLPQAVEYPVTIPPNSDASQCVTCHADKTQGKHVHAAMAMGCTTGHSITTKGRLREGKFAVGRTKA
jgi:hypothetical protein